MPETRTDAQVDLFQLKTCSVLIGSITWNASKSCSYLYYNYSRFVKHLWKGEAHMKTTGIVLGAIFSVLIMVGVSGCQSETNNSQGPKTTDLPMKVGRAFWPGTYWVDIAHQKGWFKMAGLNVVFVDTTPDYVGSLKDMVAGKIDVNGSSLFDLMKFNVAGSDLVMVINADNLNGAEAILANSEIQSLKGLKEKKSGLVRVRIWNTYWMRHWPETVSINPI